MYVVCLKPSRAQWGTGACLWLQGRWVWCLLLDDGQNVGKGELPGERGIQKEWIREHKEDKTCQKFPLLNN